MRMKNHCFKIGSYDEDLEGERLTYKKHKI